MTHDEARANAAGLLNPVVELMRTRLVMGAMRYGRTDSMEYDFLENARLRMKKYEETGNREHLVDALNYLLLEHAAMKPGTHFRAQGNLEHVDAVRRS